MRKLFAFDTCYAELVQDKGPTELSSETAPAQGPFHDPTPFRMQSLQKRRRNVRMSIPNSSFLIAPTKHSFVSRRRLKLVELLDLLASSWQHAQHVEADLQRGVSKDWVVTCPFRGEILRTVLLKGRHWPTVTWSPSSTRKAGETCAARFLWRFS